MTTAEAIEAITDAGLFEILATRVLRQIDDDCELLEHMGVNAAGKTIANPIDCFCLIPSSNPPRFVMAAFTTDKLESLERKWLFDHATALRAKKAKAADDGDLIKAARRAESLRRTTPDATFVVHLCTNKQPDDELMSKVLDRGRELGLDVRFLARSRLRDVLDTTPNGQWLRKEHLGIQADRLSLPLLRELSEKSLRRYEGEFLVTPPQAFVPTGSERAVMDAVKSRRSVNVVVGASGTGKSVACYQTLRSHLASGGIGLWIPGEIAARASSLDEAINDTLRSLHPLIEPTAGAEAIALSTNSQHFLLVVDDINRGVSPTDTLRKLLTWRRPTKDEKSDNASHSILIPAWDLRWAPLDDQFKSASWLTKVPISPMEADESRACLAAALGPRAERVSVADQSAIVDALGRDPILIALYAGSVTNDHAAVPPALALQVIGDFVRSAHAEAAASSTQLVADYDSALLALAIWMLASRDLYPRWNDVQEALSENAVTALRELARTGKVCRVTGRAGENRFEFRHDRILEHFLVTAIQGMLTDPDRNTPIISDPFYCEFVGRALATSNATDELVAWIARSAPLALIASIRFMPAVATGHSHLILDAATRWLKSASQDRNTPSVMLFAAYRLLENIDSPHVLSLTTHLSKDRLLGRARLANGSADAITIEFGNPAWFTPALNDRAFDAVFDRAMHRHKQTVIDECLGILKDAGASESNKRGALILAGFIGHPSLATAVRSAWESLTDRQRAVLPSLWAGMRCGELDPPGTLDSVIRAWLQVSDNQSDDQTSDRMAIAQELKFAVRRGISVPVLKYLIGVARATEGLRWPITFALDDVDNPFAITFLLEEAAEVERRIKGSNRISHWFMSLKDRWDPTQVPGRSKKLALESVEAIRSCWKSLTKEAQLRETAFSAWIRAEDDLEQLRTIPENHPNFEMALWRRVYLGDRTTVPQVFSRLSADTKWFYVLHHIWSPLFRETVDNALTRLAQQTSSDYRGGFDNDHFMLAHLLRDLAAADAEPLLLKHWHALQCSPLFVQAALYLGSPECVARATEAIAMYPSTTDPFKYIDHFFGFITTGLMERLEQRHLDVLIPFLHRLDDHALSHMADSCQRQSRLAWAARHLKPELDRRRALVPSAPRDKEEYIAGIGRHFFPSDSDLIEDLDWIERHREHYHGHMYHWSAHFDERQNDHSRWSRLLDLWLRSKPNAERFEIVASAILDHGTRSDIALLTKHTIEGDATKVAWMRSNAIFGVMRRTLVGNLPPEASW